MKNELFDDIVIEILDIFEYTLISDRGKLLEEVEQRIDALISTNTTYYHQIENVLVLFEHDRSISEVDIDNYTGKVYRAHQFQDAKRDCAQAYLYQRYYDISQEVITELYTEFINFIDTANSVFTPKDLFELDDIELSTTCDNGWIPHSYESDDGKTIYWTDSQLDGINAVSRHIYGFWMTINVSR